MPTCKEVTFYFKRVSSRDDATEYVFCVPCIIWIIVQESHGQVLSWADN